MMYLLLGPNSYQALRKIGELKSAFYKKSRQAGGNVLVEEFDGDADEIQPEKFYAALEQGNLFSKTRLVIFKNVLESNESIFKILKKNGDFIKASRDIFVFWEKESVKSTLNFFKKYAEKIQEVRPLTKKELAAWVDKKAKALGFGLSKEECAIIIEEAGPPAGGVAEWALENELEKRVSHRLNMLASQVKSTVVVGGIITQVKKITTRNICLFVQTSTNTLKKSLILRSRRNM